MFHFYDFEMFGNELEHKRCNIILDTKEPQKSFMYVLDMRGEITEKYPINYKIL